jgi:acetophenone carboxylase
MEDLKKNIVSKWTAEQIYRVAYEPDRRKVDQEKTKQQRDAERRARIARGKSWDDFHRDWNKKSPPQEILQYYGSWPDAKPLGPVFRP